MTRYIALSLAKRRNLDDLDDEEQILEEDEEATQDADDDGGDGEGRRVRRRLAGSTAVGPAIADIEPDDNDNSDDLHAELLEGLELAPPPPTTLDDMD